MKYFKEECIKPRPDDSVQPIWSKASGNLVNRGEVEEGDEDNGDFTWTLTEGDQLLTEFRGGGELGGIYIPKRYTIKEISTTTLRWVDIYDRSTNLTKIN